LALKVGRYSEVLDKVNWFGRWNALVASQTDVRTFAERYALYRYVNDLVGTQAIAYLEFGVARGDSLRAWLDLRRDETSVFVGFDTFQGLPEDWDRSHPQGTFSAGGRPPSIDDPRVSFEVGLFQTTLRPFPEKPVLRDVLVDHRLVVHLDADLYSATLFVLTQLDPIMAAGTIVLFDEFQSVIHEFRAWCDYVSAYQRPWKLVALADGGEKAAVELG
jgi:O-methyltransferase